MSVLEWFCDVDGFMLSFAPQMKASQLVASKQRQRGGQLWPSEIMTILIHFHQSIIERLKRMTVALLIGTLLAMMLAPLL